MSCGVQLRAVSKLAIPSLSSDDKLFHCYIKQALMMGAVAPLQNMESKQNPSRGAPVGAPLVGFHDHRGSIATQPWMN